jgi:TnpA family transposase
MRMELAAMAAPGDFPFNNLFQNGPERQAYYERSPRQRNEAVMPRSLLSNEQRARLFAVPVDHAEMAKHYVLSADDLTLVRAKRRSVNRLGFAVQLCLLRYPGLGMGPAEQLPEAMITFVAVSSACGVSTSPTMHNGIRPAANMPSNCKDI